MRGCTRPDWSDESNDNCICDNHDEFNELHGGSCECCYYWEDVEERE